MPRFSFQLPIIINRFNGIVIHIEQMATDVLNVDMFIELSLDFLLREHYKENYRITFKVSKITVCT